MEKTAALTSTREDSELLCRRSRSIVKDCYEEKRGRIRGTTSSVIETLLTAVFHIKSRLVSKTHPSPLSTSYRSLVCLHCNPPSSSNCMPIVVIKLDPVTCLRYHKQGNKLFIGWCQRAINKAPQKMLKRDHFTP